MLVACHKNTNNQSGDTLMSYQVVFQQKHIISKVLHIIISGFFLFVLLLLIILLTISINF